MLFPTDPDKRPDLWAAFADKLAAGSISFVVHSGERLSCEVRQAQVDLKAFQLGGSTADHSFLVIPYQAPDVDGVLGRPFFAGHVVCLDPTAGVGGVK